MLSKAIHIKRNNIAGRRCDGLSGQINRELVMQIFPKTGSSLYRQAEVLNG